jgi:hypothetical protein
MANCSIPNSTPATGRTSTTSSKPLKKQNSPATRYGAFGVAAVVGLGISRLFNAQRPTLNTQHSIQAVGRWTLEVERWTFSLFRRVKGAWWPSRSSKPSSPRKWRGRFDSYPLRHLKFDGRCLRFDLSFSAKISPQTSTLKPQTSKEGGEPHVA